MELGNEALFALGLFAALWLLAGLWAVGRGIAMQRRSAFVAGQTDRLASLIEASPQLPVVVRADWRIEASERLGLWLGLDRGPRNFDELRGLDAGLGQPEHEQLRQAILGAQRGAVIWMVLRRILLLAAAGLAISVPATLAASRLVKSFLFDTQPNDPGTLALAGVVLLSAAILAGYAPARRASRIDPLSALRHE